jgi:ATP-binding cassette subfamily B protein
MLILGSGVFLVIPLISIAFLEPQLLLAPLLFIMAFYVALRDYVVKLNPVSQGSRVSFGTLNAGLQETVSGIEVVKSAAQEPQEKTQFIRNANEYRDWFVKQGEVEARYLPLLLLSMALAGGFLHAIFLYRAGNIEIGQIVAYMGMFGLLRFPTFISIWSFSLVQLGYAGAGRILSLMNDETDLDENPQGFRGEMNGAIEFQNVSFGYDPDKPVINGVNFKVKAGQTVAIVGQTGSGKSSLTKLVNRIYDATSGTVLIDGIDVRDWSLDSLRSQISVIEQDVFLFSRSVADNIGFGAGENASDDQIQRASRDSQSLRFIEGFEHGFETQIGERGVTLSGGQRQRIALARAFLTNPRILILDDSTSAIDSATEDEIQKAIRRAQEGRTVLLITHRLSQIRWADLILVMRQGSIVAQSVAMITAASSSAILMTL